MPSVDVDVDVTPVAAANLKAIHERASGAIVRLYVAGRGCCRYRFGLALEETVGSDDVVGGSDDLLVVVAEKDRDICSGVVIDYVQGEGGEGFTVRTPGAAIGCSCGGVR